jgi:hypothetical protein
MSNWKIKVESRISSAGNSLVRLAIVVNVLIQYPHKKIRVMRSCGVEKKLKIVAGTIPQFIMIITWRGEQRILQMP